MPPSINAPPPKGGGVAGVRMCHVELAANDVQSEGQREGKISGVNSCGIKGGDF